MAQLRDPAARLPVGRRPDHRHHRALYTIEEAYEVADAIARDDIAGLREELGDLLLQVVFHARMAEEAGQFAFPDVVAAICDKMVRRHPHVFGSATVADAGAQTVAWEATKAAEASRKPPRPARRRACWITFRPGLPALKQAEKLQKRAARVGFDWTEARDVIGKVREEIDEVAAEFRSGAAPGTIDR